MKVDVKIKVLKEGHLPVYKHQGDACLDCMARVEDDCKLIIKGWSRMVIPLGFAMELPTGWEAVMRPRSGLSSREGIMCVIGTIDSPYRNEVGAIIYNFSNDEFEVSDGDRICQMKIQEVPEVNIIEVDELSETDRGEGFGSSGV